MNGPNISRTVQLADSDEFVTIAVHLTPDGSELAAFTLDADVFTRLRLTDAERRALAAALLFPGEIAKGPPVNGASQRHVGVTAPDGTELLP